MKSLSCLLIAIFILFISCTTPTEFIDNTEMPSQLIYAPNSMSFLIGTASNSSVQPSIDDGNSAIIEFKLNNQNPHISINPLNGIITVVDGIDVGNYPLNISVSNSIGTLNIDTAYTINVSVQATAPVSI